MSTLPSVELGVLGPLQVRLDGMAVAIPGAKPRAILTMLGLHGGSVVSADTLIELLWGDDPPRTAAKALQTHISALRRTLGDGFVLTKGAGWTLADSEVDAARYRSAAKVGREAAAAGETGQATARFEEALTLWRGIPELPDGQRGLTEKTRWIESHAALVEDRADAMLATGRAAEVIGDLEAAVAEAPLRERRWGQLMLALYRAGRQGEALAAYQRARALLVDQLGVDPGPELRRLEAAIVAQDASLDLPVAQEFSTVTRTVTFLLTDIEGSTAAWEADADAMAVALARHDELVEQVVTSRGGRLIKTRGEGDATFSVFERPSAAAAAAIEMQDAISHEPWALAEPMRIRVALHTGEVELRDGDYFGRAVNRAARLRSLAEGGQILCSGATAELVIDSLADDVVLTDLGMRQLKNLARAEHVFELCLDTADDGLEPTIDAPIQRPDLPAVLTGSGPFVGRGDELDRLLSTWQSASADGVCAMLIAGEPGVGKTRLAGEWSQQAYQQGAIVLYGRCDEDLGAPYQPFAEALRALAPCLGTDRLRGLRGVEALLPLVPGLTDLVPDLAAPTRADPDTERYALFDAVVAILQVAAAAAPVVLILDDLHWAAKPTLLLLRHVLRFGERARIQIVGTYRSTDVDRSHPLGAMLADLHRDGTASPLQLTGLDPEDVTAYVAEAGYDDEELARALAAVTGGNPFFLIEALRHVDENGGVWDRNTLPQGVRDAVSRRLSRLPAETNKALAAAAVVGSRFAVDLVEQVVGDDLIDAFDEASKAGIVIEEPGGYYRFNHALVRQSLLAELASMRRMRLHQRIATTLETQPGADDELLAELAHHYFECAWAGNAAKAVEYCRRAADQAMARLAYEGAADLYDHALHALEELDDELPDRDEQVAELLVARCEALLAAGDVSSAPAVVSQLRAATVNSARLAAWATSFDGELSMLIHPERLDEVQAALGAAAQTLAGLDDAAGEAKAHTVRAACLHRLGRIADCEVALDDALTAARRAREHRRVNEVLAGAPLAALWGPNPVPRAGGRCLDVVRLLRITTDSPAVEATSTRCQAVLEAFRGRAEAARRMIDTARRTVTELGLRHALLEVEQFAGIVELVVDDPAVAESFLRQAYKGFRRMGLDADTAETAALLGRACLALDRDTEADELSRESERLAGNALKASIAWRTLRAQLLARRGEYGEARELAEAAVARAERTDALVDHGDACLTLAKVLGAAGDAAAARAAAERAVDLYERKGAAALAEKARSVLGQRVAPPVATPPETPAASLDNACVRTSERVVAAIHRGDWDEIEQLYSPHAFIESRRKIVGFTRIDADEWVRGIRRNLETEAMRFRQAGVAVRGERLALLRVRGENPDESPGAPYDEFLSLNGIDEDGRLALQLWFDIDDIAAAIAELDAAHARFEQQPKARRLENAATRVTERFQAHFAARDWEALAETVGDKSYTDDRRRVVNAGIRHDRDAVDDLRALADVGFTLTLLDVIAVRGERLALTRVRGSGRDPEAIESEALNVVEVDADERFAAVVVFDSDDFEAAVAELDARYVAGEAAAHAQTWSTIARTSWSLIRHELPPTTPDWVNLDHRRGIAFAPGDMAAYIRDVWDVEQSLSTYIETVQRLNNLGAVFVQVLKGTSQEGLDAEWRIVELITVEGDLISRGELFDEADLEAAITRFDQLSRPARRLENKASQLSDRFLAYFAARDWDAMAEITAEDFSSDDRRRVVGAGVQVGRDVDIENMRAWADVGIKNMISHVVAIRGQRLFLGRTRFLGSEQRPDAFHSEVLGIVEVDDENQVLARVVFDLDDFDAAIAELDARYLTGEAAAHAHTWSVITRAISALNRREILPTTPDWVNIDHRRGLSFAPGELPALLASWNLTLDLRSSIEAVHRLNNLGAVISAASHETSQEGLDAEWRAISVLAIEHDRINRAEFFDEADLDVALARFEELTQTTRRLENAASRVADRFTAYCAAGDWQAMAEVLADNYSGDDRRRVVGSGVRHGRDAHLADMRARAGLWPDRTSTVMATRGERLALIRVGLSSRDQGDEAFVTEVLIIDEINADERLVAGIAFDLNDFDAAIAELDRRYLVGEAAAHARTWSVIVRAYWSLIRHELPPTTPDWVNIDHRRGVAFAPGDMTAYLRDMLDSEQSTGNHIEVVHRLNNLGAVFIQVLKGTSQEGFDAEWRLVTLMTVDGDLINRAELFDEADLDVALARFDELNQPPRLENAASQAAERLWSCFAAHDWVEMAETMVTDVVTVDHRRVVNGGVIRGRELQIASLRASYEAGVESYTSTVIATRGKRVALTCLHGTFRGLHGADVLNVVEVDADNLIAAGALFDPDDFDAAIAELDARYLAGEASPQARLWSAITGSYAAINRHEQPAITPDWVTVDHRRETATGPGDLVAYLESNPLQDNNKSYVETVHRLDSLGAVITYAAHETSQEGFYAEWRGLAVFTVEGDLVNRCEVFDEADLDAAIARFDQLSRPTLKNATSQAYERICECLETRDWQAVAELCAENVSVDDRRRVVNAGIRTGQDAAIEDLQVAAEIGFTYKMLSVIATRGARLAVMRVRAAGSDPETVANDALNIVELDADGRIAADVIFDLEDIDAAFDELDARYLAGEAADHPHAWSVIAAGYASLNRHEVPEAAPDYVIIEHQLRATIGDLANNLGAAWDLTPDLKGYVEAVHRLCDVAAVVTHVADGTSPDGVHAEWRGVHLLTFDGNMVNRCEIFDEADLDDALARFDELQQKTSRLENAASAVVERFWSCFASRDWDAIAETMADEVCTHDHRRIVNAGVLRGRAVHVSNMRAVADVGFDGLASVVIATRGDRLVFIHIRSALRDSPPGEVIADVLGVIEINADHRIVAAAMFDADQIDAAFAELDARYLAGEAAVHADTWSLMAGTHAALNRQEIPATTPDCVSIDHRRGVAFVPGDLVPYTRDTFNDVPDARFHIVAVHRLSDIGAVITGSIHGASRQGLDAEWQNVGLFTFEGQLGNRVEIFDETDLDVALARFDELQSQTRHLDNAAIVVAERFWAHFAKGDWDAVAEAVADDFYQDDRRRTVGAGVRHGRDQEIVDLRAIAALWAGKATPTYIATRGERLALMRVHFSFRDQGPEGFVTEVLGICEINADERMVAAIAFDPDDLDAAFEELDSRYLAGEAAAHARTWMTMTQVQAAYNRHEVPRTTKDVVNTDHRRARAFASEDVIPFLRATYEVVPNLKGHIEVVHRLSNFGTVVTEVMTGTSQTGFDAEWREIGLFAFDGELVCRSELFDETDLDAALAHFDELQRQTRNLENTASQAEKRFGACFASRDWDAMAQLLSEDFSMDDRRRIVNAGVRHGRDAEIASQRAIASVGVANWTSTVIAIRGARLVLGAYSIEDGWSGSEALCVTEINTENQLVAHVAFDPDDLDAAFEELDARYLAGEAAAHSDTWSVITRECAAFNRHKPAAITPDPVYIDHRHLVSIEGVDMGAAERAVWNLIPDGWTCIKAVHRLSELGAVVTQALKGSSPEGFYAEWQMISIFTVEGDLIRRYEVFDETDLDAALARFDELHPQARRLENSASRMYDRYNAYLAARDWDAMAEMVTDDICHDDRRRVVSGGIQRGRDAQMANVRAIVGVGVKSSESDVIATRGERLALTRARVSGGGQRPDAFGLELLNIIEIDTENRVAAGVSFDVEDIDAAFEELDARYLAGEAAAYSQTWSVITQIHAAFNRHELPAIDWIVVDHRRGTLLLSSNMTAAIRAFWDLTPAVNMQIEEVHRLNSFGAVATHTLRGTSPEGFEAEWRMIYLVIVEDDGIDRVEIFDEADLDAALARFDELQCQKLRLENAASVKHARLTACVATHDWNGLAEILADDIAIDDRRRVVNSGITRGRDAAVANMGAVVDVGLTNVSSTVIATRGDRLDLCRTCISGQDLPEAFQIEFLSIVEIDADERIVARVLFDPDDIDAAFDELDARYMAGDAAPYSRTWSAMARTCAVFNQGEMPATTPDSVYVDHRPVLTVDAVDLPSYLRAMWDVTPDIRVEIEAVHRLSELGVVVTQVVNETSPEGFNAEWRGILIYTLEADIVNRCEVFDEADLEAALARFDELDRLATS